MRPAGPLIPTDPPRQSRRPAPALCDDAAVTDPARRDPAWLWYGLAAAALVALLLLDLLGILDRLGP